MTLIAKNYAIEAHGDQKYGDKPYSYHLEQVVAVLSRYTDCSYLISAAWLHDVIEDTGISYFELTRIFGSPTANIVWGCTGIGRDRKARQASIRAKLGVFPGAPIVKLADRIANLTATIAEGRSDKFEMYLAEHVEFGECIVHHVPYSMYVEYLDLIIDGKEKYNV